MGIAAQRELDANERCLNCGAQLTGPYCAQCGQRTQDPDPTFRELFAEAWDAFVSVDGKAMSSLRILGRRPGALTKQYLMGHRARVVPPLRLYLARSVAFFLVSAIDLPSRGREDAATGLWMLAYLPLALREVYGGRLRDAIARSALLADEYVFVGLSAFMVMLLLLVLTY